MPSSLTRVLPLTLGFSPRLPVLVCGTGASFLTRGFSWQCEIRSFGTLVPSPSQLDVAEWIYLPRPSYCLDAHIQWCALLILLRPPVVQTERRRYRNINLLSIAYAFRPRLRSRLTLRGRAFLRKPWAFGERDSHSFFATHTGILTSKRSTSPYGLTSQPLERSPTTDPFGSIRSFGGVFSPGTFSAQSHSTSELLRTLSMMAASKPTSWLSKQLHILFHLTHT